MRKQTGLLRRSAGFTLIELMIVIAMIGILLAIATPPFMEWRRNLQYKEAADGLVAALRTARNNAISVYRQNRVEFNPAASRYRITQGDRAYDSSAWTTVKQDWSTLVQGVHLKTGSDCTGTADLNIGFNPNGTASSTGTICVMDSSSAKYKITVAASGRIRSEK